MFGFISCNASFSAEGAREDVRKEKTTGGMRKGVVMGLTERKEEEEILAEG